jgi:glycosyltransferase involved in cell wall biosynthesis
MEQAVYHLARHLRRQGVEPLLLTRPPTETAADFPGAVEVVRYQSLPAGAHGRVLDRTLNYPGFAARVGERLAALVRERSVDVVDAQGISGLGYARRRRREPDLRAPLVMNPQGLEEHKTRGLKWLALARLRRLSRETARLADRVIATDTATRGEVEALLGVPPERVAVIPNGIDIEAVRQGTPEDPAAVARALLPELEGASPVLLSVGRLESYKGFLDVLEALEALQRDDALGPGWLWVVVGEGPLAARLDARRRQGGAARRMRRVGRVDAATLHALYEVADVFVHATRFEGSSLVTLEAMAHARAVVATRAGGIPDKVTDGETGRLVEPGDVPALAAAIREVLGDPARPRALGLAGAERAQRLFGWEGIARRVKDLYRELIEERRA